MTNNVLAIQHVTTVQEKKQLEERVENLLVDNAKLMTVGGRQDLLSRVHSQLDTSEKALDRSAEELTNLRHHMQANDEFRDMYTPILRDIFTRQMRSYSM
jgi:hypothetical protein